jgi:dihydropyrimidinase
MSTVIKNGTIVTHDLTYKADILIEDGKIAEIGRTSRATRNWTPPAAMSCPAGSIRMCIWKCRSWAPIPRTTSKAGTRAALAGGTTMVVDFCLPNQGEGLLDAIKMWDNKSTRAIATIPSTWRSPGGASRYSTTWRP